MFNLFYYMFFINILFLLFSFVCFNYLCVFAGETHTDRISLLHTLATLPAHPESVPVNALVPNAGTPLEVIFLTMTLTIRIFYV
jgi:hypothetical protein